MTPEEALSQAWLPPIDNWTLRLANGAHAVSMVPNLSTHSRRQYLQLFADVMNGEKRDAGTQLWGLLLHSSIAYNGVRIATVSIHLRDDVRRAILKRLVEVLNANRSIPVEHADGSPVSPLPEPTEEVVEGMSAIEYELIQDCADIFSKFVNNLPESYVGEHDELMHNILKCQNIIHQRVGRREYYKLRDRLEAGNDEERT